ncbi:hypothetical protein HU200_051231 [Digitaria exilis]|uniref:Uncharacterized protein n=1 Tax=Digitaria exilis TaxID=1010633 RepID=A0A835AQX5_9POAL|nr:hypothetical protein HU200_051231 [Digitaria exilis]
MIADVSPGKKKKGSHATVRRATKFAWRTGSLTRMPAASILHQARAEMATAAAAFRSNKKWCGHCWP